MGGIWKENWKRGAKQKSVSAVEGHDLVRVEDLHGFHSLLPSDGSLIVGSGSEWVILSAGISGYVLTSDGTNISWEQSTGIAASGTVGIADLSASGFVVGPLSAINRSVAIYDGTTGKLIRDSLFLIDSSGNASIAGNTLISGDLTVLGNIIGLDLSSSGFVVGPTSSLDRSIAIYDGTTGKLITDSLITIDSSGNLTLISGDITVLNGTIINSVSSGTPNVYNISNTYFNAITSATTGVFLPLTPTQGQQHIIKDINGTAGSTPITVDGNGNTIDGSLQLLLTNNYESTTLIFGPTEWNII
jgi:hypothetical protein